jgi:urease accessory protein
MLTLHTKIDPAEAAPHIDGELILPFELREKSRLRASLASGEEVAVFTQRGTILRNGELLRGDDGRIVKVVAQAEATYRVVCASPGALLRCAFHLGNRHTQAQLGEAAGIGYLRIRQDSVLKEMLERLGATVTEEFAPFEPESGAYGAHQHGGGHNHPLAPIPQRQKIHRPSD